MPLVAYSDLLDGSTNLSGCATYDGIYIYALKSTQMAFLCLFRAYNFCSLVIYNLSSSEKILLFSEIKSSKIN